MNISKILGLDREGLEKQINAEHARIKTANANIKLMKRLLDSSPTSKKPEQQTQEQQTPKPAGTPMQPHNQQNVNVQNSNQQG